MHCTAMIACPRRQRAGWCTSGDWGHNCDWRASFLERAATRPCTPTDLALAEALAQQPLDPYGWRWTRCQSTPPSGGA